LEITLRNAIKLMRRKDRTGQDKTTLATTGYDMRGNNRSMDYETMEAH